MAFHDYVSRQFADPKGLGGKVVGHVMNRQNRPMYGETARLLGVVDADRVLDIGCGNGFVVAMMAARTGATFTGVDRSASAVRAAARRNQGLVRAGRATFLNADAEQLPFAGAAFTKAFTINTVYFWEDLAATLAQVRRVLARGGLFVNTFYGNGALDQLPHTRVGYYKRHAPEALHAAAEHAGFVVRNQLILRGAATCAVCRAE
ncbi:MAG: class I SAM-dependent methyltransferase [Bifidobacteriaceae bacterium]|jgi:ubiquinone/menaquinone biosynthesis C-methylase UbiE|nr:class I SAM-dependent methyltransferase [Bifidobacteriaceae bacterium]